MASKPDDVSEISAPVHVCLSQPKQVFWTKTWSFAIPNQVGFVPQPNQNISSALPQDNTDKRKVAT